MNRRRFIAPERPEGAPAGVDGRLCQAAGLDNSTASLVRRHVDSYFRAVPNDALRLTGALLSSEGLGPNNPAFVRRLTDDVHQHVKQSIRCEVGLLTWLMIAWRLYQLVRLVIEIYSAEPGLLGSLADVPAEKTRR